MLEYTRSYHRYAVIYLVVRFKVSATLWLKQLAPPMQQQHNSWDIMPDCNR